MEKKQNYFGIAKKTTPQVYLEEEKNSPKDAHNCSYLAL